MVTSPRTLLTFAEAQAIGAELHARWEDMSGKPAPFEADDAAWGDLVQYVCRRRADYLGRGDGR